MTNGPDVARSARSFPALVAAAFIGYDIPDATEGEIAVASDYVDECLTAMPDLLRIGVSTASGAACLAMSVLGRSPYRWQSPDRRARAAVRLTSTRLPVLTEFCRLTRGLALVSVFEQRTLRGAM